MTADVAIGLAQRKMQFDLVVLAVGFDIRQQLLHRGQLRVADRVPLHHAECYMVAGIARIDRSRQFERRPRFVHASEH